MKGTSPPPARELDADDRALALVRSRGLLDEHLQRLRDLPAHGNTKLHADQLVLGLLLWFFEPMARSLRLIEGCGDFGGRLDLSRLARSTTADALAAFDPKHLRPLIEDLRQRCPGLASADADLAGIIRRIVAADGTYLTTLADVAWAGPSDESLGTPCTTPSAAAARRAGPRQRAVGRGGLGAAGRQRQRR